MEPDTELLWLDLPTSPITPWWLDAPTPAVPYRPVTYPDGGPRVSRLLRRVIRLASGSARSSTYPS
ncbi:hypothetical protein [Actinocrispum wychmicini]|uniref:hypothetical protein n=1 Tax=Actinocrispum wychmicini TaxID=1213861 RepID=UPI0010432DEF|nr:hypothetical protein [Actinocrispum wychmicini]